MSRFRKLSHTIWHCQYHIIWVPKYRYRVLVGPIQEAAYTGIQAICGYLKSQSQAITAEAQSRAARERREKTGGGRRRSFFAARESRHPIAPFMG